MKKIIALLLLLTLAFGLVSCGDGSGEKAPEVDGYQMVSGATDPFYLYVPNSWTNNASSGMSSAYYGDGSAIMVSAFFVENEVHELPVYTAYVITNFQKSLTDFKLIDELSQETVGGNAAYGFNYSAKIGDKEQMHRTYVIACEGGFIHLTYSAETTDFELQLALFDEIAARFVIKGETINDLSWGGDVINGWQIASSDKYEFEFFVPKSWTVDKNGEIPTATIGAEKGDLSNVTMMSYVLTEPTTAEEFWHKTRDQILYKFEEISTDDQVKLGGLPAYAVEYKTGLSDFNYMVKQVFCVTSNMAYVFTYTSTPKYYESHMNSVDGMLDMFLFN